MCVCVCVCPDLSNFVTAAYTEGTLRLVNPVNSSTGNVGRLEIFFRGQWGTVCDDNFGYTEAAVACRQLGYSSAAYYSNVGYFR